jgi:hypothetical protein
MLNRTEVLKRLLLIRKHIYNKEMLMEQPPSIDDIKIRKELDQLIKDVIGDFLTREDQEAMDKIVLKAVCGDISIEMALVAIKEIIYGYYQEKQEKKRGNKEELSAYYNNGYR